MTTTFDLWGDSGVLEVLSTLAFPTSDPLRYVPGEASRALCARRDDFLRAQRNRWNVGPYQGELVAEDAADQILVSAEKARQATVLACLQAAALAPQRLLLGGYNDVGIATTVKRLQKIFGDSGQVLTNRARGRIVCWQNPRIQDAEVAEQIAPDDCGFSTPDGSMYFQSLPGVFSANKCDQGSWLLVQNMRSLIDSFPAPKKIIDLGCGVGVLVLHALQVWPESHGLGVDVDARAVACARRNAEAHGCAGRAEWTWWDAYEVAPDYRADLVLCNPPWHTGTQSDIDLGRQMLKQAAACCTKDGRVLLVANRKLPYEALLNELFAEVLHFKRQMVLRYCRQQVR